MAEGLCPKCLAHAIFQPSREVDAREQVRDDLGVKRIGDYELLECIARGGMGVVYRARQVSLQREVAVKVLLDPAYASPEQLQRFRSEAAVAAALRHPNIVAIHDIHESDGQRFFSMDFVAGKDLAELTRRGPLPPREAAHLVLKIADAVHHCHERGILHRDLKPSNVLVDAFGEPHVTDFGLAKRIDGVGQVASWTAQLTASGQVMGTPGYMSPEQATAKRDVGPAADIYSTGALLYHLLTGRAPFVGDTPTLVLRQVEEQEPVSPRLLNANVAADLETICLKCLAKEPRQRYGTARDL
ncbi:MAG: serine/threonine-protein kinase, partial [Limisphaerales bacterium]